MRLTTNRDQSEGEESARRPRAFLRRRNLTVFVNCAAGPDGAADSSKVPLRTPCTPLDSHAGGKGGFYRLFVFASVLQDASSVFWAELHVWSNLTSTKAVESKTKLKLNH